MSFFFKCPKVWKSVKVAAGNKRQHSQYPVGLEDTCDVTHFEEEVVLEEGDDVDMVEDQAALDEAEIEDEELAGDDGKVAHDRTVVKSM
jgi:hypothetical protein